MGVVKKAVGDGEGGRVGSGPAGPWACSRRHDAVEGRLDGLALGTKEKKVGKLGKNTAKYKLCRNLGKKTGGNEDGKLCKKKNSNKYKLRIYTNYGTINKKVPFGCQILISGRNNIATI